MELLCSSIFFGGYIYICLCIVRSSPELIEKKYVFVLKIKKRFNSIIIQRLYNLPWKLNYYLTENNIMRAQKHSHKKFLEIVICCSLEYRKQLPFGCNQKE